MIISASGQTDFFEACDTGEDFYFSSTEIRRLKSLKGFQSGAYFIPKMYTSAVERFVEKVSFEDIMAVADSFTAQIRNVLNLKSTEYQYEHNENEFRFQCDIFQYRIFAKPNSDNLASVFFHDRIFVQNTGAFKAAFLQIFPCLPFAGYHAHFAPSRPIVMEDIIEIAEKSEDRSLYEYEYSPDKSVLSLHVKNKDLRLEFTAANVDVHFLSVNAFYQFVEQLRDNP